MARKSLTQQLRALDPADVPAAVEAYAQAASGRKYSPTIGARRITAAMLAVGAERGEFRVRNDCNSAGEYEGAILLSLTSRVEQVAYDNRELLAACGLRVVVSITSNGQHTSVAEERWVDGVHFPAGVRIYDFAKEQS